MNVIINKSAKNVDKDSTLKLGDTLITYGEPVNVSMSQYAIATDSDMLEIEVVQFDSNEKEVVKEDILANIVLEEVDVYDVIMCQINDKMGATSGQQPSIDSVAIASLEVYKEVKKRVYESQNEINITGGIIGS